MKARGTYDCGWAHDYDRIGNKRYQEDLQSATQSELYGYDTVYRLDDFKRGQLSQDKTDITNPTRTQTWTLDPLGNWDDTVLDSVTESRVHDSVNELTQRTIGQGGAIDLTYDDAGNLAQDGSSNGDHQYVWDYRNRLIQAKEKQSGDWNTVGTYRYDARGRRVRKAVTNKGGLNGTTRLIWGGDSDWQCLEERDGSDSLVARFTYSPGYIDAVAVQERDLNADSDFGDTNELVYYQANTLFTVYCLTDDSGAVVERYRYDAYGGCTVLDADGSADADGLSDVKNPYTFTARRLDLETGLMQYRNRYYSPTLGRFVSRDPIGYQSGFCLCSYVSDRPTASTHPLGLAVKFIQVPPKDRIRRQIEQAPHMPPEAKRAALEWVAAMQSRPIMVDVHAVFVAAPGTWRYACLQRYQIAMKACLLDWGAAQDMGAYIFVSGQVVTGVCAGVGGIVAGAPGALAAGATCEVVVIVVTGTDFGYGWLDYQLCMRRARREFDNCWAKAPR